MTSPRDLERKVRRLEENMGAGPLTPLEPPELAKLEMEYQALNPVPLDDMT